MTKPGVLLVGPLPPPVGGLERVVEQIATSEQLAAEFRLDVINTNFLPPKIRKPRIIKDLAAQRVRAAVQRTIRQHDPAVMHLHTPWGGDFWRAHSYAQVALSAGMPVLLHLHSGALTDWLGGLPLARQQQARNFLGSVARIAVIAPVWVEALTPWCGPTPLVAVPNGLDFTILGSVPDRPTHDGPYRLLTVGRLERAKGTLDVLEACRLLDPTSYELTLVGRLSDPEVALPLWNGANAPNLRILGELPFDQLLREYARADALLFMSHVEGLGLALLEGLALGLPVITSGAGGIGGIMRALPNNPQVQPGNPDELAVAIQNLATDPAAARRVGAANAAHVRAHYSVAEMMEKLADTYRELAIQNC